MRGGAFGNFCFKNNHDLIIQTRSCRRMCIYVIISVIVAANFASTLQLLPLVILQEAGGRKADFTLSPSSKIKVLGLRFVMNLKIVPKITHLDKCGFGSDSDSTSKKKNDDMI